jgi:hypothetical protein|tara:strand:+ start:1127 stop:1267 length:141 start_codon:yes stop_codon:yes gene_type:complete
LGKVWIMAICGSELPKTEPDEGGMTGRELQPDGATDHWQHEVKFED